MPGLRAGGGFGFGMAGGGFGFGVAGGGTGTRFSGFSCDDKSYLWKVRIGCDRYYSACGGEGQHRAYGMQHAMAALACDDCAPCAAAQPT